MASQLGAFPRASAIPRRRSDHALDFPARGRILKFAARLEFRAGAASGDGGASSYLDMWKKATDRERKTMEFQKIVENSTGEGEESDGVLVEGLERKSEEFQKILEVSREERDRVQRLQVVDRAAAAIAAARAVLEENGPLGEEDSGDDVALEFGDSGDEAPREGPRSWSKIVTLSDPSRNGIPGPEFWSWIPPASAGGSSDDISNLQTATSFMADPIPSNPVVEKERSLESFPLLFESGLLNCYPPLPPLQSLTEVQAERDSDSTEEILSPNGEYELGLQSSANADEVVHALEKISEGTKMPFGATVDGTRWWKETGVERRADGVICRWTMTRGVSADQTVEWQEKFWEASDDFGYKELGSEKSGRDAFGNVWREFWRESMWQERGLLNIEKTADKWGKNGHGGEWQEKWWERYNASGEAEKSADKWCKIDPNTPLEAGHAHIWHERWGEKYDGHGGSTKYTDKWAERSEGPGWAKWGDKWDEGFDPNGHGMKQGEKWWEGNSGERWNRTWGERHDGSGWVHKYGASSAGEHWDTRVQQDTWHDGFPHFGFYHCFDNSAQLRGVPKPSDML